jgi:catechol 2,3-dioxygenase-like lactoylglutathione lyase family enzyme
VQKVGLRLHFLHNIAAGGPAGGGKIEPEHAEGRRDAMPVTTGFNHVATLTTNADRLVEFYGRAFGAETTFEMEARDDHPRMLVLDLGGGAALNVFEVGAEAIIGERRRQGGRGAIDHFGLAVDSLPTLEAVRDRLVDAGADIGDIQQLGGLWSLFFRDPDGMELEVCCHGDG